MNRSILLGLAACLGLLVLWWWRRPTKALIDPDGPRMPPVNWHSTECLHEEAPSIYRLHRFLSANECKHIVEQALPGFRRSQVVDEKSGENKMDHVRTSSSSYLNRGQTAIIQDVERRALQVFGGLPPDCVERLQVVRYQVGEKYDAHHDFFHHVAGTDGQRYATILVYLNDDFDGGSTSFPKCGVEAKPITGDAIAWYNCRATSKTDCICFDRSLHQGNQVSSGTKYALNIWIRFP